MRVAFRADASTGLGSGHVMRSLTLAEALVRGGASVRFVSRENDGNLCDLVAARGIPVERLPVRQGEARLDDSWLGGSWEVDARQTKAALAAGVDWLVVDHYGIDERWERALRDVTQRIMVIDDLADRPHDCDLLLDQNLATDAVERYAGKVPVEALLLLGPRYALLQPDYAQLRDRAAGRSGPVRRILVSFGGGDVMNLTGRCVRAFLSLNRRDVTLDVVIAGHDGQVEAVRRAAAGHANVHVHERLPTLAPLMAAADLAVGGGGSSAWERLCLGLPTIVVTLADNQRAVARELHQQGVVTWLGHHAEVDEPAIAAALTMAMERGSNEDWSRRAMALVDGQGTQRVCAAMTVTGDSVLRVRPATPADEEMVLRWANDPVTRRNAFSTDLISPAAHHAWFQAKLANVEECRFYIMETTTGVPVGQVRFDRTDDGWEISYLVAPGFRGRGLGRRVLGAGLDHLAATEPASVVVGRVKEDNVSSQRVFQSLGFVKRSTLDEQAAFEYGRYVG
jgi:UDP-2,4-diacetamido-2,4,6-trideoxy-beta-L-altropyranose hydrolase